MPNKPATKPDIRAVVFDAYGTLFDVYSVGALAEQLFPGKGSELSQLWRLKQIEYTQLRTLASRYRPFWEVTQDALVFSARRLGLELSEALRDRLMNQYACLSPFPENAGALKELKALGVPTGILSNGTPQMLDIAVKSAGMVGLFDHILSVERGAEVQDRTRSLPARDPDLRADAGRDFVRFLQLLGRGRRHLVRLHHVLDQPQRAAAGGTGHPARRHRQPADRRRELRPGARCEAPPRLIPIPSIPFPTEGVIA